MKADYNRHKNRERKRKDYSEQTFTYRQIEGYPGSINPFAEGRDKVSPLAWKSKVGFNTHYRQHMPQNISNPVKLMGFDWQQAETSMMQMVPFHHNPAGFNQLASFSSSNLKKRVKKQAKKSNSERKSKKSYSKLKEASILVSFALEDQEVIRKVSSDNKSAVVKSLIAEYNLGSDLVKPLENLIELSLHAQNLQAVQVDRVEANFFKERGKLCQRIRNRSYDCIRVNKQLVYN